MVWGCCTSGRRRYDIEKPGPTLIWGTHGAVLPSAMLENGMAQPPFGAQVNSIRAFDQNFKDWKCQLLENGGASRRRTAYGERFCAASSRIKVGEVAAVRPPGGYRPIFILIFLAKLIIPEHQAR